MVPDHGHFPDKEHVIYTGDEQDCSEKETCQGPWNSTGENPAKLISRSDAEQKNQCEHEVPARKMQWLDGLRENPVVVRP